MKNYSTGTIRKRQKSKNSDQWEWQGLITVTEDGKKRQLTKMTGVPCTPPRPNEKSQRGKRSMPTGKGAKLALETVTKWRDELVAQDAIAKPVVGDLSVVDFVRRYIATLDIEPGTKQNYSYLLRHIELINMPISELTAQRVEDWKLEMVENGTGGHMRNKAFNILKYACAWGQNTEALVRNPCASVKAPPRPKHEPNPLDPADLPRLTARLGELREAKPVFADMSLLALNTGMRRGELCALKWSDVNGYASGTFEGCIHVNRAIATINGGTYEKDYPKSGHRRKIDINDDIKAILRRRKDALEPFTTDLSSCYVFAYPESPDSYPSPGYITKLWNMFASMNGFLGVEGKHLRFHDLRDTFATVALINGVPVVTVAAILGHESEQTTYTYYSHFIPSKNKEAMDFMGGLLNAG